MHVLTKFNPHTTYTGRLGLKSFFVWIDFFSREINIRFLSPHTQLRLRKTTSNSCSLHVYNKKLPMILGSISSKDRNLIRDELTHVVNDSIEGRC